MRKKKKKKKKRLTTTAPIPKPHHTSRSKSQLPLRPHLRHRRRHTYPLPTTATESRRSTSPPNLHPRARRIRQITHQSHPNLRGLAPPARPHLRSRGLRPRPQPNAHAISHGIPLRAVRDRDSRARSGPPVDYRSRLHDVQIRYPRPSAGCAAGRVSRREKARLQRQAVYSSDAGADCAGRIWAGSGRGDLGDEGCCCG